MNKKREPYDKIAVGERIRHKRMQLGLSQDELAVRINRATKYCSDFEKVVELDRYYILNWSLGLDVKILFRTVPEVVKKNGSM